jgi:Integrase zinc binding domain
VYTDYKNFIYFTTTKKLNRQQVRWSETLAKYNFRIAYKKGTKNAKADALSRRLDFIGKEDRTETLLKEGEDSLEYSSEIATIYKVIKDPTTKQRIWNVYKGDAKAQMAKLQKYKENRGKPKFVLNETGLIRFKEIVYLLEKIRKEFVKEIYEELLVEHLGIDKTRKAVTACYYFPFILRIAERIVKECDICNKSRTATHKLYRLLMSPLTPKEL